MYKNKKLARNYCIKIEENASSTYNSLVNFFIDMKRTSEKNYKKHYEYLLWAFAEAKKWVKLEGIMDAMCDYILLFKNEIENENVDKILNFDYSLLIQKNTKKQTNDMIIALSEHLKYSYVNGDDIMKEKIKIFIIELYLGCLTHRNLENEKKNV